MYIASIIINTFISTEYMVHCYMRADGIACVAISDHEYPYRVAHTMLNKVMQERNFSFFFFFSNHNRKEVNLFSIMIQYEDNILDG